MTAIIAACLCFALSILIIWALQGQPAGDRYDEEAETFLKALPATIGFLILVISRGSK